MKKRLRLQIAVWLAFALILSCGLATAQPPIPHHFYGIVTVGGLPALDGTVVTAKIGGVPVESTETFDGGKYTFKVPGNSGDTIVFFVDDVQAATYEFQSGASTELNLSVPAPRFVVGNLSITPASVEAGEFVSISVTVTNIGDLEGTYTLTLLIDGAVEITKDITLAGGATASVKFKITKDVAGTYDVEVNGLTGSFKVTEPTAPPTTPPEEFAEFTITSLVIVPSRVLVGDQAAIIVDVKNVGNIGGTHTLTLRINGVLAQTRDVTLAGGASGTVTFIVVENVEGTYNVEVDGLTGNFTVVTLLLPPQPTTVKILSITPEAPASVDVENVAITELEISVLRTVENVRITIQELVDTPAEVAIAAPGITYRYLDIVKENITDDDISSITITFKVEKTWITAENIDLDAIALRRWDPVDEEWVPLPTTRIGEDDTYFYYSAESPELSIFAVSGLTLAPAPAEFELSNLVIDPSEVGPGEEVTISVDVTNVGELEGTCTVTLRIDNVVEATEDVTLAGGATNTVTFPVSRDAEGTYNVEIDGLVGTFVVAASSSAVPLAVTVTGIAAVLLAGTLIWLRKRRKRGKRILTRLREEDKGGIK